MKKIVLGILAHVDSGKTTLSEGLMYFSGKLNKLGRVDHKDTFLDNNDIERDRGITIYSKQAQFDYNNTIFTLVDTPGHIDFSAEMERTLQVLDYAILVISGADGVQSHAKTLWNMLEAYQIPTFVFVNKMDITHNSKEDIMRMLYKELDEKCVDFNNINYEKLAVCSDCLLEEFLADNQISDSSIVKEINSRNLFPVFFGSALKLDGINDLLCCIDKFTVEPKYSNVFGAKVYKITTDDKGQKLTHIKVTGGELKVKTPINDEKINEIRIYNGNSFTSASVVFAGEICTVLGLNNTYIGMGMGFERDFEDFLTEPLFKYSVKIIDETDIHSAYNYFKILEQQDNQLKVTLTDNINVHLMGDIQIEVLTRILKEEYNLSVEFEDGAIIYKETIADTVEGVGHYEPLRHYAEVHLLLEPMPAGTGVVYETDCSEDILDKNWQRLIYTHLNEKTHLGVLTGSEITDIKITLINGRASVKHTVGGDFRQATYRAVRHGLMNAKSILLEPYNKFKIQVPVEYTGRIMTDLQQMGAEFSSPDLQNEVSVLTGTVPVSKIYGYLKKITSYTGGKGKLSCSFLGYYPCKNSEEVIQNISYNPEGDLDNTPDSVFCQGGAGFLVKWNDVYKYMHIPYLQDKKEEEVINSPKFPSKTIATDEELLHIFERTYGKVKRRLYQQPLDKPVIKEYKYNPKPIMPKYLLIDGYNIIFSWDDLKSAALKDLSYARELLINRVANIKGTKDIGVIIVFDAYKVKGCNRETETINGVEIVYTKEAETADAYIEMVTKKISKHYSVTVATSDSLEQLIILGHGARRISAREFLKEVEDAEREIREYIEKNR